VERGLSAKVVIVEPTGSETHALLRVDGQDSVAVFRGKWTAKPGDMIAIDVDPADVLLFDRETGVRL
jgi:multiple sugar transport system ATP-binding protein